MVVAVRDGAPIRVLDVNDAACKVLNFDSKHDLQEAVGLLPPSFVDQIKNAPDVYNTGLSYPCDDKHLFEVSPLNREAGIYEVCVSKRHEAIEEFEMLSSIFETSDVGIIITSIDGTIIKINPGFSRMFGWKPETVVGTPYSELIAPEDRFRITKVHERFMHSNGRTTGEISILDSHGNIANTLCTTLPLMKTDSKKYLITTAVDITFRKRIEKSLKRAKDLAESSSRAKSSFLAQMSHELRTPLNAIIGFSEMLINETFGKLGHEKYNEYIDDIHGSACHLLDIVNDVLNMSRIESGNVKIHSEVTSMTDLLRQVTGMISTGSEDKRISLEIDIPPNLPQVNVDVVMFRQVFINLISNAYKHCGPNTIVKVSGEFNVQGDLVFTVSDNGPGIPASKLEDIVKPFGQVDDAFKANGEGGAGLGLPISKGMVELHGGVFKITSELGKGTHISLSIPERRIVDEKQVASEGKFVFNPQRTTEGV
jgi:two-component system, cell cycle sensor histidine kinase PleC